MNLREAKRTTMGILSRWTMLSMRNPRLVVIKNRTAVPQFITFSSEALARRYANAQINPDYYGTITVGGR